MTPSPRLLLQNNNNKEWLKYTSFHNDSKGSFTPSCNNISLNESHLICWRKNSSFFPFHLENCIPCPQMLKDIFIPLETLLRKNILPLGFFSPSSSFTICKSMQFYSQSSSWFAVAYLWSLPADLELDFSLISRASFACPLTLKLTFTLPIFELRHKTPAYLYSSVSARSILQKSEHTCGWLTLSFDLNLDDLVGEG